MGVSQKINALKNQHFKFNSTFQNPESRSDILRDDFLFRRVLVAALLITKPYFFYATRPGCTLQSPMSRFKNETWEDFRCHPSREKSGFI